MYLLFDSVDDAKKYSQDAYDRSTSVPARNRSTVFMWSVVELDRGAALLIEDDGGKVRGKDFLPTLDQAKLVEAVEVKAVVI